MTIFQQQETTEIRNRTRAAWATFHKYRQELTSRNCMLKHRWTLTKEHERMSQSTQRKMFRLIVHTKRRYKKITKRKDETNEKEDSEDMGSTGDESEDGQNSNTHNDQDSDISFENDTDEEIDTTVIEEENGLTA